MQELLKWRETQTDPLTGKSPMRMESAAAKVGATKSTWSRWENGVEKIGVGKVRALETLTGIPSSVLRPDIFGAAG